MVAGNKRRWTQQCTIHRGSPCRSIDSIANLLRHIRRCALLKKQSKAISKCIYRLIRDNASNVSSAILCSAVILSVIIVTMSPNTKYLVSNKLNTGQGGANRHTIPFHDSTSSERASPRRVDARPRLRARPYWSRMCREIWAVNATALPRGASIFFHG